MNVIFGYMTADDLNVVCAANFSYEFSYPISYFPLKNRLKARGLLPKIDTKNGILVPFTVQDIRNRTAYDSRRTLKKLIQHALVKTNWHLSSDNVDHNLGILSGQLIGDDRPDGCYIEAKGKVEFKSQLLEKSFNYYRTACVARRINQLALFFSSPFKVVLNGLNGHSPLTLLRFLIQ